jgi:hypothetical protein
MSRPYTEEQVFALEQNTDMMTARLLGTGRGPWTTLDDDTLEAILYDAMIALREQMIGEDDE